ncbi:hypothetical protein [Mycoplasmopsis adleri]|uniref:hypothetical protein n=1 Tax=Mycoplasmopsis adleri TaxID=51362 RepID=UPI0038738EE6
MNSSKDNKDIVLHRRCGRPRKADLETYRKNEAEMTIEIFELIKKQYNIKEEDIANAIKEVELKKS